MASPSPSFLRSNGSRGVHFCPVIEGFHCQVMPAAFIAISFGVDGLHARRASNEA
jgi:hypothetical protein